MEKTKNDLLLVLIVVLFSSPLQVRAGLTSWLRGLLTGSTTRGGIVRGLSDERRMEIHMRYHSHLQTDDEIRKIQEDVKQFLNSPLDVLKNHPDRILDSDESTRRVYLSLVVSGIDPSSADDVALFTDSVFGGFLRQNGETDRVAYKLGRIWSDVERVAEDMGLHSDDLKAGVISALINNDFSYTGYIINEVSHFEISGIARLHDNLNLKLQPGNPTFMSLMMKFLDRRGFGPSVRSWSRIEEILFFWKYINLDHNNSAYRDGTDFLSGKIESLMKPPFVFSAMTGPYRYPPDLQNFFEASRESVSLEKFIDDCLTPLEDDMGRIERVRQKLFGLKKDSSQYKDIMNTPGIENFSIEDWERILHITDPV